MAYRFERDEVLADAFARTAREQLERAERALTEEITAEPVPAIHGARKAIKRERTLLRLTAGALSRRERRQANASLRGAARRLSVLRDAEATVAALDELADRYTGQIPHTAFTAARERLEAQRQAGGGPEAEAGAAAQAATELAAVRERIGTWQLRRHDWDALEPGVSRTYRRGAKAFARAERAPTMENLHAWRKRAKDLWYELRLLAPVSGEMVRGQARDAHELADMLGDDHDLAVLRDTLLRVGHDIPNDVDAILGLVEHRREELQSEALRVGARVYAESPKAFRRRLRRSWAAGRGEMADRRRHQPASLAEATRPPAVA